ncbi:MAG: cysteine desulfurase [Pirellulaceae bacterium]|nr:MAG: cysteine desulfurase [Pirellulaceae bacterium]
MRQEQEQQRIYLDNAATSWPKLDEAVQAALQFVQRCGAASGRGVYRSAREADHWIAQARLKLAQLIGAPGPESLVMCHSGTHALNLALSGLLRPGQRVLTTATEHNSVLRPLRQLAVHRGLDVQYVPCDSTGRVDIDAVNRLRGTQIDWVILSHASNVTGAVQDLKSWTQFARCCGGRTIVDAAQTLGYLPIDVVADDVDVLAAPGHKGLRALPGTGFLYLAPDLIPHLTPMMWGGTGEASQVEDPPLQGPSAIEVGNLNTMGIVSMAVAANRILEQGGCQRWHTSFARLITRLREVPGLKVIGPTSAITKHETRRVPVVSISLSGWDAHDVAIALDSHFRIEVRAGFHCAARIHAFLGSEQGGGTVRLSPSESTSEEEIDRTVEALHELASAGVNSAHR